ncbi:MAG: MFS transporter [Chloroflexia bacterium]|nr:MFS transporter [Chloroflexia bacterium]
MSPDPSTTTASQAALKSEGSFHVGRVTTIGAAHAMHDTYSAFLPPLLPRFIEALALSNTQAGLLKVFLQAPSLLQPAIGRLADQHNLRLLVILAPAVTATMMSLLGIAPHYALLALFLLVAGASSASIHAVGPVLAGKLSGRSLGRGMSFWMVGGELGRTLGPLVVGTAIQFWGLGSTPWLLPGGLLASGVLYLLLRDIPYQPSTGHLDGNWQQALRSMSPLLLPLSGVIVARSFLGEAMTTYLPTFLESEGSSPWLAGAALTALEAAGVGGALLGGSLSDRLGRRRVLFASLAIAPFFMALFVGATMHSADPRPLLQFPILMLLGFSHLALTPVIMALVQECYPENRALANGAYMALSFVLRSLITLVVGALGDLLGLRLAFFISAGVQWLSLPLVRLLPIPQRQRKG